MSKLHILYLTFKSFFVFLNEIGFIADTRPEKLTLLKFYHLQKTATAIPMEPLPVLSVSHPDVLSDYASKSFSLYKPLLSFYYIFLLEH